MEGLMLLAELTRITFSVFIFLRISSYFPERIILKSLAILISIPRFDHSTPMFSQSVVFCPYASNKHQPMHA